MRHQGFVEFEWPGFEHEIDGRTESTHTFEAEFGQLTGLEGRQRGTPDLRFSCKLSEREPLGPAPYSDDQLRTLAAHCTVQEGNAAKVERQIAKSAAALLLESRVGQQFDAIVTGASDKGTWVRIRQPLAEGRLVKGFDGVDVGDTLRVQLTHTDVQRGFIDFARVH